MLLKAIRREEDEEDQAGGTARDGTGDTPAGTPGVGVVS
jgi:hypothetical protein